MTVVLVVAGALTAFLSILTAVSTSLLTDEARTRFERLPSAILRLAVRRLPHEQRGEWLEEWGAELAYIARKTPGLPITRLVKSLMFAIGIVRGARKICAPRSPKGVIRISEISVEVDTPVGEQIFTFKGVKTVETPPDDFFDEGPWTID